MASLPLHNPQAVIGVDDEGDAKDALDDEYKLAIVQVLASYFSSADSARKGGANPRDTVWEANWNRYWGRYDHSNKADWQSTHVMPEAPQFVDRWAAAMREALDAGGDWFEVTDDGGQKHKLAQHITKVMRVLLGRCGVTPDGHMTDFSSVFEDQMKLGAIMAACAAVTPKDHGNGLVLPAVDSVDPRNVWLDPERRGLFRLHRYTTDKHELLALAQKTDDAGEPLYDIEAIEQLTAQIDEEDRLNKERSSGSGSGDGATPGRTPVVIDEWLATVIMNDGTVAADKALIVVANGQHIIRGPEPNPFWHGADWITLTPMISVPFSPYGRSYMEDWSSVADAFIEMTNLILDGAFTSATKVFVSDPTLLQDPTQLADGISPNMVLQADAGVPIDRILKEIDLGGLDNGAVTVWQALKQEMREGAKLSEIALGQLPPNAHHTATAVSEVTQSGSAMIRSMARTMEARGLEPILTQVWQVALQHTDFMLLAEEIGEETAQMLTARKEEFSAAKIRFRVRGISGLIDRQSKLRNMLGLLQTVSQNELLVQALMKRTTGDKLFDTLMRLIGIDPSDIDLTTEEKAMALAAANLDQPAPAMPGAEQPAGGAG